MPVMLRKSSFTVLVLGLLLCRSSLLQADDSLLPVVPEAQERYSATQGCVEPTEEMRRNHMKYILHQRDETVHEGIRTRRFSLEGCINCHVSDAPDAPRVSSKEHFCNSCHSYAAVSIDCFQCHADRPSASDNLGSRLPGFLPQRASPGVGPAASGTAEQPKLASRDSANEQ